MGMLQRLRSQTTEAQMSKSIVLTIRLDPDVMTALKMQAAKEKRKVSNLASILIEENVKRLPRNIFENITFKE
jgi:hypothetical protein